MRLCLKTLKGFASGIKEIQAASSRSDPHISLLIFQQAGDNIMAERGRIAVLMPKMSKGLMLGFEEIQAASLRANPEITLAIFQ